jgi:putative glutamine amidotransferase
MGTTRPVVSSYHHQAVDRLGAGLVATGRAEDGVIEVVQHTSAPILAVQWHPEDDADVQPDEQALFDAVVDPSVLCSPTPPAPQAPPACRSPGSLPVPTGAGS